VSIKPRSNTYGRADRQSTQVVLNVPAASSGFGGFDAMTLNTVYHKPTGPVGEDLSGKVVIVTGAAGGIGSCISQFFAACGASLLLADIRVAECAELAKSLQRQGHRATAIAVDVVDPVSAENMVSVTIKEFGLIDVLINCAGIDAPRGLAWELNDQHWRRVIDADLSGSWWCSKAVIPHMIERRSGRIIFIGSVAARRGNRSTSVAYNAAKAGLNGLTIGLAKQLEPYGILVNTVAPGPTGNTGEPMTEEEVAAENAQYPLGLGGPEPIAHACLYLARNSGNWVSGSVLNVSGGRWQG
jgi:NAD(P)-dependent dehydrogenase (short-subunit alcohol dehydrogenase family)